MPNDTPSPSLLVEDFLWPLLIVQPRGAVPLAHFEEYLVRRHTYLRRQEKHVVLFDLRHASMPLSEVRQRQSEWLKQHAALIETQVLGHALVVTSPFLRLIISTFHKLRPRNSRLLVTPHLDDAARWCLDVLEESGSNPPTQRIEAHFGLKPH
jgi:hypothetical protein